MAMISLLLNIRRKNNLSSCEEELDKAEVCSRIDIDSEIKDLVLKDVRKNLSELNEDNIEKSITLEDLESFSPLTAHYIKNEVLKGVVTKSIFCGKELIPIDKVRFFIKEKGRIIYYNLKKMTKPHVKGVIKELVGPSGIKSQTINEHSVINIKFPYLNRGKIIPIETTVYVGVFK